MIIKIKKEKSSPYEVTLRVDVVISQLKGFVRENSNRIDRIDKIEVFNKVGGLDRPFESERSEEVDSNDCALDYNFILSLSS